MMTNQINNAGRMTAQTAFATLCLAFMGSSAGLYAQAGIIHPVRVTGIVRDSATAAPLSEAIVRCVRNDRVADSAQTGPDGRYTFAQLTPGTYQVRVIHLGYHMAVRTVAVASGETGKAIVVPDIRLASLSTHVLSAVQVNAGAPVAVDVRDGNQSYQQHDAHAAPTTTTSQILQSAIAGAARAPTGEVHIRGQHGEYTYYVDGVPVPAGISGSLNELFDPTVIDRIEFQTGGWDAEFGNKNIAVVNVATRIPVGGWHVEASGYGGSFGSTGQTLTTSSNVGAFGMVASFTHQSTDMRREPVMRAAGTDAPLNFHNHGTDEFGFVKLMYVPSPRDRVTLDANLSSTRFQIPFDSTGGTQLDDYERDGNGFVNLGWRHRFGDVQDSIAEPRERAHELFMAMYVRPGSLRYTPGVSDVPAFVFYPDTTQRYTVQEDRSALTTGVQMDYTLPMNDVIAIKTGFGASLVTGHENFQTRDSLDQSGPSVDAHLRGGDAGVYVQSIVTPSAHWELRTGVRLDHHVAPLAGDIHQLSPRIRLAYFPNTATSLWLYYGRLFIPSNVEDFHVLASAAQSGTVGLPTVPERDRYYEGGMVHHFDDGVTFKFVGYYRDNGPAIDDNTLPGTAVTTTVNIARVHVTGLESVLEFHPATVVSGYVNAALSHASAHGPITGGFFPTAYPNGWFDQDHDQRLSIVASGDYTPRWGYVSLTGIYGSGLTNGHPEAAPNLTGLFDFNRAVKVAPSCIWNIGVGTTWLAGTTVVRPELFVDNALDRKYILKGAFTSGPSIGRPRSIQLKVTLSH